ncbi:MAG: ribosomal L7Ae/L30e/S12e/Gadd45 family protein [Lachnospiraceae bacterium]|nr:ribosomal L7Ae/L30e/S12e/Gadd45 family protein [Lachnospiraceae bacterium]
MQNKILSYLGLSMKAGKVVSGEFSVEQAVKTGKAEIVIVAEDASKNTKKLFNDKCSYYNVPEYVYGTKEQLGRAIGKEMRASVAVIDAGLANKLEQELKTMNE